MMAVPTQRETCKKFRYPPIAPHPYRALPPHQADPQSSFCQQTPLLSALDALQPATTPQATSLGEFA